MFNLLFKKLTFQLIRGTRKSNSSLNITMKSPFFSDQKHLSYIFFIILFFQVVTTYEIVDWEDVPESVKYHFRKREEARQAAMAGKGVIDKKKKTCMLYLQADHLFYEAMGSEEACIEAMTRHVQRVNR